MRSLSWAATVALVGFIAGAALAQQGKESREPKTPAEKAAAEKGTHTHTASIDVKGSDGKTRLQTLAVDADGRILALVAAPRGFGAPVKDASSEIQIYSGDGKQIKTFTVKFHAHSLNAGPGGDIYVAGDGKIARFDKDAKPLAEFDLPYLKALLDDKDALKKQAQEQIETMKKSVAESYKQIEKQKKDLEAVAEDKRTPLQKKQLQQYEAILKNRDAALKQYDNMTVDSILQQQLARLRVINSVCVSKQDIFVACGETKGYGYAVWRMDHEFKNPKQVITGLSGCCGQMDVQVSGDKLLVAENTKHQFGVYDRDGKRLSGHGKRGTDNDPECFGSCCNPMNLRAGKDGDVYTAESEGIVKRFSAKGDFLTVVGFAPLTGGCKNVAVGAAPDGSRVYFADQPGSRVIVLTKKTDK